MAAISHGQFHGPMPADLVMTCTASDVSAAALADTPKGQQGRPSKSLTLDQTAAVITTARTLPVMELRPGLKDVRRPAKLMHAYITLSLLTGIRTEEAHALRWAHVDLDGDPAARLPVPPHIAVWRSVPRARRDQDRTIPPHPRPPRSNGPGAARLVGHASTRTTEIVYRRELRPVITTGAEIMDELFSGT